MTRPLTITIPPVPHITQAPSPQGCQANVGRAFAVVAKYLAALAYARAHQPFAGLRVRLDYAPFRMNVRLEGPLDGMASPWVDLTHKLSRSAVEDAMGPAIHALILPLLDMDEGP